MSEAPQTQTQSMEERLNKLEQRVKNLEEGIAEHRNRNNAQITVWVTGIFLLLLLGGIHLRTWILPLTKLVTLTDAAVLFFSTAAFLASVWLLWRVHCEQD